ncbi:MAG: hypothetical protein IPJ66_20225 [Bacteroidetes bacterium]|nr:hypothetical protein [Bacteroidota bacterium]MBL0137003.1 hypothetical protein [Bacteroidota bacterium]
MIRKKYTYLFLLMSFCGISVTNVVAIEPEGEISFKGEDFPAEKKAELFCADSSMCLQFKDELKKTATLILNGRMGGNTIRLEIETPATLGPHKIKLDKDGDPKPGEKFYIEILGPNSAVDKSVYTIEDESDDATVTITEIAEETGTLHATFSGRFFDGATGVKRAQIGGSVLIK